ncbi:MAG: hypothetical protein H0U77_14680 [Nocardioidaceae bacterium]|nr:hypothetical protein [Nocardioidaceae bacterium]
MALLLPLLGGVLAGWLAPKRTAILLQAAFAVVAATVVTASAPLHGEDYGIVVYVVPITVTVSVAALYAGFWLRQRRAVA